MTRVLALANQKGGVGKTTTAINLGAALAQLEREVLVIDLDPQANATTALGLRAPPDRSTYDIVLERAVLPDCVLPTVQERLSLVPSTADLAGAEIELTQVIAREFRLQQALNGRIEAYDFVLIDCPPSLGVLTVNGLAAAQEVIVPVQCEFLALDGLRQLTHTLDLVRRHLNRQLILRGLLLTMYDKRTSLSQQVADEVRRHFENTFRTVIPRSVRLSEAPSHGLPIQAYDPRSQAAFAYNALAREVLETVEAAAEVAP